jgi:prevent-host-death family protein
VAELDGLVAGGILRVWRSVLAAARLRASLLPRGVERGKSTLTSRCRLHYCATMKTATVRDLRNRYTSVLRWVSAGEDVLITQRGIVIARLSPETKMKAQVVDWASSPEVLRDRSGDDVLSAEQSAEILAEAGGRW